MILNNDADDFVRQLSKISMKRLKIVQNYRYKQRNIVIFKCKSFKWQLGN